MKVLSVIGTRPEAIKMSPVIKQLALHPDAIVSRVCVTAQHREIMDQVLDVFEIAPDFDLNVMTKGQSLGSIASKVVPGIQKILEGEEFDCVLVQGDTTSAVSAALAAFYSNVPVGHIEAGLRTFNRRIPFPEEINRRLLGALAEWHYAPTENARQNLLKENVPDNRILVTGNTVIDALNMVLSFEYDITWGTLSNFPFDDKKIVLVTVHRRENFKLPLEDICKATLELAEYFSDEIHVVWPVHPNPNVKPIVERLLKGSSNVSLVSPLNYIDFCQLMKRSHLILTDSGGIQEEAPTLGIPVLVLREATERPEAVEAGVAELVGTSHRRIVERARDLLTNPNAYNAMSKKRNPFGNGDAAQIITTHLLNQLGVM